MRRLVLGLTLACGTAAAQTPPATGRLSNDGVAVVITQPQVQVRVGQRSVCPADFRIVPVSLDQRADVGDGRFRVVQLGHQGLAQFRRHRLHAHQQQGFGAMASRQQRRNEALGAAEHEALFDTAVVQREAFVLSAGIHQCECLVAGDVEIVGLELQGKEQKRQMFEPCLADLELGFRHRRQNH